MVNILDRIYLKLIGTQSPSWRHSPILRDRCPLPDPHASRDSSMACRAAASIAQGIAESR